MPDTPAVFEALGLHAEIRVSNVDKKSRGGQRAVRLCNYMDVYTTPYLGASREYMLATADQGEILRFGLHVGDVVITKDSETPDDIGIASVIEDVSGELPLVCGYHLAILRPTSMDPVFLAKQLGHDRIKAYFAGVATGSTRYGLSAGAIHDVPLLTPPPAEQQRIALILRAIDTAVHATEQVISKLQKARHGLLEDLLTRGIGDNGELRDPVRNPDHFKDSPIGRIPRAWELGSVETEFDIASGLTLGPHRRPRANAHPYLRVANVFRDRLDLSDVSQMEAHRSELAGKTLAEGDILVVEGHANPDEIGRAAMATEATEGFTFQNHLFRLRPRRVLPGFAVQWMNSAIVRRHWRRFCASSSGLNTINQAKLRIVPTVTPPIDEQERLVEAAEASARAGNQERAELAKLRLLRKGLSDVLLTRRIPVASRQEEAP